MYLHAKSGEGTLFLGLSRSLFLSNSGGLTPLVPYSILEIS